MIIGSTSTMTFAEFKEKLTSTPELLEFQDTIALIDDLYSFTSTSFINGNLVNEKDQNNGSCKLFSFAKIHNFSEQETLACFGAYYRVDVLLNPHGDDHQNIRNFMKFGWNGVEFHNEALSLIE